MQPTLTDVILDAVPADRRPQPRLTYYDDRSGERTELSTVTLANWAAKTANLMRDEFGLLPGFRVSVALPVHWQTAVILLGTWWAGGEVVRIGEGDASDDPVDVAFTTAQATAGADADEVIAVPLDPFALALPNLPIGIGDFGGSVRLQGDRFTPTPGAGNPLPAGGGNVVELGRQAAEKAGIAAGDRVLSTLDWSDAEAVITGFVAPLVVGASLVQVQGGDPAKADHRAEQEKVTRTL